jgi:hypothetical protein
MVSSRVIVLRTPPRNDTPCTVSDIRSVATWFASLSARDQRRWYTVEELRSFARVPRARLLVALYRLGWQRKRSSEFGLALFQGPFLAHERDAQRRLVHAIRLVGERRR